MAAAESLHILLPTDVFPPRAGGSGWSSLALAQALLERGHRVTAIVPRTGVSGIRRCVEQNVPVIEVGYRAPSLPFAQNYYRFEGLWPLVRNVIVLEAYRERELPVVIHAQHAQTIPAAVLAGRELGVPVAATIRDAWPWHYFATGLLGDQLPFARQTAATAWLDLIGRLGALKGVLAAPAIPYMLRHTQRRAALLAQADAIIACSGYIGRKLAPLVPHERLHVIPHLINVAATVAAAERSYDFGALHGPLPDQFLLFVGKLQRNKGAHLLPELLMAVRNAGTEPPPLLIAGDGALEAPLGRELAACGLRHQFLGGWINHDAVLRLMRKAEALVFPSAWGEPLSRVLLEASAVGACVVAMNTGGTSDLIVPDVSGVLVNDATAAGQALATLLHDPARRTQLRTGAQRIARERFAAQIVAAQMERLYADILTAPQRHSGKQA